VVQKTGTPGQLMTFQIQPTLLEEIRVVQNDDPRL